MIRRHDLVPVREMDSHRPYRTVTAYGRLRTGSPAAYDDAHRLLPRYPLLDGPRGVGNAHGCLTFGLDERRIQAEQARLTIGWKCIFCDGWRVCRVTKGRRLQRFSGGAAEGWAQLARPA